MNEIDEKITEVQAFEQNLEKDLTDLSRKHTNYFEFLESFNKFVNKVEKIEQTQNDTSN